MLRMIQKMKDKLAEQALFQQLVPRCMLELLNEGCLSPGKSLGADAPQQGICSWEPLR